MATYNGNDSNNTYTGTADGDSISGNGGKDTLNGAGGADTISGGSGADSILGGDGNDLIDGGSGKDRLFGGTGDDTLAGGTSNDSLTGDAGTDTASYAAATGAVTVNLGTGSATGADGTDTLSGIENVVGSAYSDALTGDGGANVLVGGAGNDTLSGAGGDDSLSGGVGQDSLSGGEGNDTLIGSDATGPTTVSLDMNWMAAGSDEADITSFSQDAGGITVTVTVTDDGQGTEASLEDDKALYTAPGETFDPESALYLAGSGAGDTSTTVLDFSATPGSGLVDEVQNVTFRINDIDASGTSWQDIVTITAYDADGNPVPVTLTPSGGDTVTGNTISAEFLSESPGDAGGSVLVGVAGPVSRIEIDFGNTGTNAQNIYISDVQFQAVVSEDDVLDGGVGDDLLIGGTGDDTLTGGDGADSLDGGTGDDSLSGGAGNDTLAGGQGADTLAGNQGMDFADYSASDAGVTIDLGAGAASGGHATGDVLSGVDGVIGSQFDDSLTGFDGSSTDLADPYTNVFYGGAGDDTLDGRGGGDSVYGEAGRDSILGGAGDDLLSGGTGADTLIGGDGADALAGGEDQDVIFAGIGDTVDGGEGGADADTLDLSGAAPFRVTYDTGNPENGTVTFFSGPGKTNPVGTLTFSNIETIVTCFTAGTRIETPQGPVPVQALAPGDLVLTRDHGAQPIRWIGRRDLTADELRARPALAPVRIAAGALGQGMPERDLLVSPQHRVLMGGWKAELLFGEGEVLAAALHLLGAPGIGRAAPGPVSYIHLMFDRHELVLSEGAWTESFQPGDHSLRGMDAAQRAELAALFPDLDVLGGGRSYPAARRSLRAAEARVLIAA